MTQNDYDYIETIDVSDYVNHGITMDLNDMSKYKYNEDRILQDVKNYIDSTYNQHYVAGQGLQTLDIWQSLDIAPEVCQGTALKYIMRFGKKEGYNKKDLMKAIHYIILLMHFSDQNKD